MKRRPISRRPGGGVGACQPSRPPALAERLLARTLKSRSPLGHGLVAADADEIRTALAELHRIRAQHRGARRAAFWYWRQVASFPWCALTERGEEAGRTVGRRAIRMILHWIRDTRHALRGLVGAPGYTMAAVLALALGIASLVPTFTFVEAYLLRPLPFDQPDRLVHLWETSTARGIDMLRVSYPDFQDWRERSESFVDLAFFNYSSENWTGGERPERIASGRVSANLFSVLGVDPVIGRTFLDGEDRRGSADLVILSHDLWMSRFGGDPEIVGGTLELNRRPHTIVGVMGESFRFPLPTTQLWVPRELDPESWPRSQRFLQVVGRLRDGVTPAAAQAEMSRLAAALELEYPDSNRGTGVNVTDLRGALNFADGIFRVMALVLLGAGAFTMLIACANVSSLVLARAFARVREVAVRSALGASRTQLVRQFLAESVLLAAAAGVVGVATSAWLLSGLAASIPDDLYRVGELALDARGLAFALVVSLATVVVFGLLPALRVSRSDVVDSLRESRSSTASRSTLRLRNSLVVGQVALALVLLSATAMMVRALDHMRRADTGFESAGVLSALLTLDRDDYPGGAEIRQFQQAVLEQVESLPGVSSAAATIYLPLNHETALDTYWAPGAEPAAESEAPTAIFQGVSSRYFATLGIPVTAGRSFTAADGPEQSPVVVVNQLLADRVWPNGDPIGAELVLGGEPVRVVGVVAETKFIDLARRREMVYRPLSQLQARYFRIVARVESGPDAMANSLREAIWAVDPDLPINEVRTLERVLGEYLLPQRSLSVMLASLSVGAIVLACVGLYGLLAFVVSQRTQEMSIRMALGASRRAVLEHVLRAGLRLVAIGVVIGLAGAFGVARLLAATMQLPAGESGMLGAASVDPVTFGVAPLLLVVCAVLACLVPARRATRVDPIEAMRAE